jgi:hypothetical protein
MSSDDKKELPIPPGFYIYVLNTNQGKVRTLVGPNSLNLQATEQAVRWEPTVPAGTRLPPSCPAASSRSPPHRRVSYLILEKSRQRQPPPDRRHRIRRQARDRSQGHRPRTGDLRPLPDAACHRGRGSSPQDQRVPADPDLQRGRGTQELEKSQVKEAPSGADASVTSDTSVASAVPKDLAVGRQYIIRGDQVAFYIPPTGVEVVPSNDNGYVRKAVTLENLEFAVLLGEDGNKRYAHGPQVVFPNTNEFFLGRGRRRRQLYSRPACL